MVGSLATVDAGDDPISNRGHGVVQCAGIGRVL
jgi:hypothetical protein